MFKYLKDMFPKSHPKNMDVFQGCYYLIQGIPCYFVSPVVHLQCMATFQNI